MLKQCHRTKMMKMEQWLGLENEAPLEASLVTKGRIKSEEANSGVHHMLRMVSSEQEK
jgi:hypothetical protein